MRKFFVLAVACFMIFSFATVVTAEEAAEEKIAQVGDMVPDFTLDDAIQGGDMSFNKDIKGKSHLTAIIFMNTGCSSCLAEIQEVSGVAKENSDKLKAYAVAVDRRGEAVVKAYHENYGFAMTYLLDPTFSLPPQFGFTYTPAMVVIDKSGKIVASKGGFNPVRDKGKIIKLLNELL